MSTDDEKVIDLYRELKEHLGRQPTQDEVKVLIFGTETEVSKLLGRQ